MSHHGTPWRGKRVVSAASAACTTGHQALHTAPSAASGREARLRHAALYRSQPFTHSLALFCHALKASPGFWGRDSWILWPESFVIGSQAEGRGNMRVRAGSRDHRGERTNGRPECGRNLSFGERDRARARGEDPNVARGFEDVEGSLLEMRSELPDATFEVQGCCSSVS
ncbi:hypothetical protein AOLI_G00052990 [Acnodon oligacanthus]